MLAGDYLTYEVKSNQSGGSLHCRCCSLSSPATESLEHILTVCDLYSDIRERIVNEYSHLCSQAKSDVSFQQIMSDNKTFCKFILDPASFNLTKRVHMNDPILSQLFKTSRDYCYAINSRRMKFLKDKANAAQLTTV